MEEQQSVKRQTLNGIKWTSLEQFSNQSISFVIGLILARLLSPSDYGVIGLLSVFMAVSGVFIDSGMGTGLVRKPNLKDIDCSTVFYFNLAVSTVCYFILFFCSPWIAAFFKTPILEDIVKVYCLTLVIGAFGSVQSSRLTINLNFKDLAQISVSTTIVSGIIGLTLAYLGYGVWALVWQSVLSCLFRVAMLWIMAKWRPMIAFSKQSFDELFGFGSKLLVQGLLWQIYSNLTPIIIGRYFSAKDLGQYTRGTSLVKMPADTILGVVGKVTFPILSKLQNDQERLVNIYRKYIKSSSMAIMFLLVLLAALARPIVLFLLTEKWEMCIIYMQIFVFAAMFDHIDKLNCTLIQVVGRSDVLLKMEVWKRIISISILLASIPLGVIGICVSKIVYEQVALTFNTRAAGNLLGMGYWAQMKDYMPYAIMSFISCAPAYAMTFTTLPYIVVILVGGIGSVLIYWAMLAMKKDSSYLEFVVPVINQLKNRVYGSH